MTAPARQQSNGNLQYAVDIVMCIDVTLSMTHILERVKASALSFHGRLTETMSAKGKSISQLRLKVIAFRDFGDAEAAPIEQTDFLTMPAQASAYESFVRGLTAVGGGDIPESGLEALALAVQSPWERGLDRRRHVIVVFTDAPAHPLRGPQQGRAQTYPQSVPRSLNDLFEMWGYPQSRTATMENSAKRLLLFAPEEFPWPDVADDWNNTLFFPSEAGDGLEEWEMDEIINVIANSL